MTGLRYLTYAEIDDILFYLPSIPGSNLISREMADREIKEALKLCLSEIEVPDDKDAILELKDKILEKYLTSTAQPGTPAGVRTAEALGKDVTQSTLNSFHYSGTEKGAQSGITAITEIMNATKNDKKNQFSRVHFKDEFLSFEEIFALYPSLVGVNIKELVTKSRVISYSEAIQQNSYYYDLYSRVSGKIPVDGDVNRICLEIKLDLDKMYQTKIKSYEIAETLLRNNDNTIKCVPFPSSKGIIHVYPIYDEILEQYHERFSGKVDLSEPDNVIKIFIKSILVPGLSKYLVRGIEGNTNLLPDKLKIADTIRSMIKYRFPDQDDKRYSNFIIARLNGPKLRNPGISLNRIEKFFEFLGYSIVYSPTNYSSEDVDLDITLDIKEQVKRMAYPHLVIILDPSNLPQTENALVINNVIANVKTRLMEQNENELFERNINYYYAKVMGNNLLDIMANPLVNPNMTISNNPYQISKLFGIGAARKVLIEQYFETFSENFINPRNIMNIVNFQTSQGVFLSVTSRGVGRQRIGPMTRASFQEATQCFVQGAAFGVYESTNSVSTSVYIGKRIKLGTGSINIVPHDEMINDPNVIKYPQKIRKQVNVDNIITEGLGLQLNLGDEVRFAGNFNMPPNYPPPRVIPCYQDLPAFFLDSVEVDMVAKIRSVMGQRKMNFSTSSGEFDDLFKF